MTPAETGGRGAAGSTRSGLVRAGVILSAAFLISRVLGYVRTVVLGATFGTGPELDAFFAAFRVPDLIFQIVAAGAMGSALIPVTAGLLVSGERARAWRLVATLANLLLVAMTVLAVAAFISAPLLVRALAPGFDEASLARTTELTRIMLVAPVLLSLGAVATSALNAEGRFTAAAIAPIVYNLGIIGAAVFLGPSMGVRGLAFGVVAGAGAHLLVQLPALFRLGFRPRRVIDLSDAAARRVLTLLAPRALGLGASQVTFIVMTALASSLGDGAISSYTIAFSLLQIPVGVIGVPLGAVLFPSMSREHALGETASYVSMVTRSVRLLLFAMVPIAAVGMALRGPVVELLFGYGQFDARAIETTAATLLLFLIGLPAHAAIAVLARAFYARQDTRTPVLAAILAVVVNTALGILLVGPLGLPGLALAIAVAAWIEATVLLFALGRHVPTFELGGILRVLAESLGGAIAAAVVAGLVATALAPWLAAGAPKLSILAGTALATIAGGGAYLGVALALRIPELPSIVGLVTEGIPEPAPVVSAEAAIADSDAWNRFVQAADPGSYLQLEPWAQVKRVNGWAMTRVAGEDIGAQVLLRRPGPLPWSFAYAPRGPVTPAWRPELVAPFTDAVRSGLGEGVAGRVSHLRIDPEIEADGPLDRDGALRATLGAAGWRPAPPIQPASTRLIDLRADEAALWGDLRKKWRQYVNRARTGGVTIEDTGAEGLGAFYTIYRETAARAGFLIRTEAAYRDIWDAYAPLGLARLLLARLPDGEPVASLFLIRSGTRVVEPYGGMTAAGADSRANYLLKWEAIRSSRDAGAETYDLWGLAHPGIAHFKTGFGGREVRYIGAWDLVLEVLGRTVFSIAQRGRVWLARRRHGLGAGAAVAPGTGADADGGAGA